MVQYVPMAKPPSTVSKILKIAITAAAMAFGTFFIGPDSDPNSQIRTEIKKPAISERARVEKNANASAMEKLEQEDGQREKLFENFNDITATTTYSEDEGIVRISRTIRVTDDGSKPREQALKEIELLYVFTSQLNTEVVLGSDGRPVELTRTATGEIDVTPLIKPGEKILDTTLAKGDTLLLLTDKTIYAIPLRETMNGFEAVTEKMVEVGYIELGEYFTPGVRVMDGKIEKRPDATLAETTIATVTNDGVIQISRIDRKTYSEGRYVSRRFCNLPLLLRKNPEVMWPETRDIIDVKLGMISPVEYLVVPVGTPDASVTRTYHVTRVTENGNSYYDVDPLEWAEKGIMNITFATPPEYVAQEGKYVTEAMCILNLGSRTELKNMTLNLIPK
jgi:hypothetical protein